MRFKKPLALPVYKNNKSKALNYYFETKQGIFYTIDVVCESDVDKRMSVVTVSGVDYVIKLPLYRVLRMMNPPKEWENCTFCTYETLDNGNTVKAQRCEQCIDSI